MVAFLRGPTRRLQRSTVKASYARHRRGASWGAHGAYLAREGAQREGGKGLGFHAEREDLDLAATLRGWQQAGDERLWKFIVSPEHGAALDLREHTRRLVGHMEHDLGTHLEWVAIDHHNTDNPHVHLLVRGRDERGRLLRIPRDYLTSGLRHRSQELATQRLGLRSDREILAAREHATERTQFTELDRALLRRADAQGLVTYHELAPRPPARREALRQELRRLQFLEEAGLAAKVGTRTWRLSPAMETALRQAQLAGDITKSRARHRAHLSDPRMPLVFTPIEAGMQVTGRLVGTGLADELHDRRYLLLEGTDGRLHYIPQPSAVERARGTERLRIGDLVTLTGRAVEQEGRQRVQTHIQVQSVATGPPGRPAERPDRVPEAASLPPLTQVEREQRRPIPVVPPLAGLLYRGRLVGYARGREGERYAVVDLGRELGAFRTDEAGLTPGREVRIRGHAVEDAQRGWRQIWRLGDEREQQRERAR